MISLAIPNFNRSDFVTESFIQVINNDLISEIVIVDDCSDNIVYIELWNLINDLNNDKIRLHRNNVNLSPFKNKYEVVKKCNNDWVILLDSDNIIDNDYVEIVDKLDKEDDILYCPEVLYRLNKNSICFNFREFNRLTIDKNNVKKHIDAGNFETWLNSGNYFLNKERYVNIVENNYDAPKLSVNDALYFSYLWLLSGNKMKIVPYLYYIHYQNGVGLGGSWYANNVRDCEFASSEIKKKIKEL